MCLIIDIYRKEWAIRYLREARVAFNISQKFESTDINYIVLAMRKSQTAIYYSLGNPTVLDSIIRNNLGRNENTISPILNFLIEIEIFIQSREKIIELQDKTKISEECKFLIDNASKFVMLMLQKS